MSPTNSGSTPQPPARRSAAGPNASSSGSFSATSEDAPCCQSLPSPARTSAVSASGGNRPTVRHLKKATRKNASPGDRCTGLARSCLSSVVSRQRLRRDLFVSSLGFLGVHGCCCSSSVSGHVQQASTVDERLCRNEERDECQPLWSRDHAECSSPVKSSAAGDGDSRGRANAVNRLE